MKRRDIPTIPLLFPPAELSFGAFSVLQFQSRSEKRSFRRRTFLRLSRLSQLPSASGCASIAAGLRGLQHAWSWGWQRAEAAPMFYCCRDNSLAVIQFHQTIRAIAYQERPAHPDDAADNLDSRQLGGGEGGTRASPTTPASPRPIRKSFFVGELDGAAAATVSCVNYGATRVPRLLHRARVLRGCGYGLRMWSAAVAHAGPRVIGSITCSRRQRTPESPGSSLPMPTSIPAARYAATNGSRLPRRRTVRSSVETVEAYDATVFPARARRSCAPGSACPGMYGCAAGARWRLADWGVDPSMPRGPARSARWLPTTAPPPRSFCRLCWPASRRQDLPRRSEHQPRRDRVEQKTWGSRMFDCAHVYRSMPPLRSERVFGVTSL